MDSEKLKPCPFCGNDLSYFTHNLDLEPDGITCQRCHIVVRFSRISVKGGEKFEVAMNKMAEVWNRRTIKDEDVVKAFCSRSDDEGYICMHINEVEKLLAGGEHDE